MCPSAAAFAIALGPTNPALIDIEQETLVFRREGFSPSLWLLVPTFLLRNAPAWVTPSPSQQMRILSYRASRTTLCSVRWNFQFIIYNFQTIFNESILKIKSFSHCLEIKN